MSLQIPIGLKICRNLYGWMCPRFRLSTANRTLVYQTTVLVLTYIAYMTYHLTRKPISVVKNVFYRNCSGLTPPPDVDPNDEYWCDWAPFNTSDANALLGALDSAFLFSYAGAMFVSGMVAERVNLRFFLTLGMVFSSIFCYMFGLGHVYRVHNLTYYLIAQAGAGIAQTTGWPGTVAILGKWFGTEQRGLIFGLWNSHTSVGNIVGALLAAKYVEIDWGYSFMLPAAVMAAAAFLIFLFMPPEPRGVGITISSLSVDTTSRPRSRSDDEEDPAEDDPSEVVVSDQASLLRPNKHTPSVQPYPPDDATENTSLLARRSSTSQQHSAVSLSRAVYIPGVIEFSLSLFFAKLVSYTFLYWLPMYIKASTQLSAEDSAKLSTVFDLGGVVGGIAAGVLADRSRSPAAVCAVFYALCAPALLVYQRWGATSYAINVALLVVGGALVNGPYALITTAVSTELGTHNSLAGNDQALATVTAIIDGTGSIGAAIGPMLAGLVSSAGAWSNVFYMLIACDAFALLLLLRIVKSEVRKLLADRRGYGRESRIN